MDKSPMDVWIKRFLRVMLFFVLLGVAAMMMQLFLNAPEAKYVTEVVNTTKRVDSQVAPFYAIAFILALIGAGCVAYWD